MANKIKRGIKGNAAQYLTRTKAIRKLQLRLGEFRRLCILKGIHPREPKKKVQGAHKTYYHVKDINFLLHEPLLQTFRNLKSYDRKIKKAQAKKNDDLAERLRMRKPGYKIDHLVKERYPSFLDAVRDMDDALTMVSLFATLPAEKHHGIPARAVQMARRLSMEFNAYVVRTSALRRVFVSIKGFYYQAEILGQSVTWLVPHQLVQVLPLDVDYRVMLTFLEFYETMLQFVNFKLYHMIGLRYPPNVDDKMESAAEELASIMKDLAGVQEAVDLQVRDQQLQIKQLEEEEEEDEDEREKLSDMEEEKEEEEQLDGIVDTDDEEEEEEKGKVDEEEREDDGLSLLDEARRKANAFDHTSTSSHLSSTIPLALGEEAAGGAVGMDANDEASVCGALFRGMVFFLSREVPREPLLLVLRAFGGVVAWSGEGSPYEECNEMITHQIVDRPTQGHKFLSRRYVQPQWAIDSANFRVLLPADLYAPGKPPPPHLSPFVNNEDEGYIPDYAAVIKKLQEAAHAVRIRASGTSIAEGAFLIEAQADEIDAQVGKKDEEEVDVEDTYMAELDREVKEANGEAIEEEEEVEGKSKSKASQGKAHALAAPPPPSISKRLRAAAEKRAEVEETEKMKDIMMTRKNRKFHERIKRAQEGKKERVSILEERKKKVAEVLEVKKIPIIPAKPAPAKKPAAATRGKK